MKKIIWLFLTLATLSLSAQISISSSDMPQSGDSLRFSIGVLDTAILLNFQNSGANLVWNFDSLVPLRQGDAKYISSAQSPYNVSNRIAEKLFDTLGQGGIELIDVYDFYNSSSTSFSRDTRGASIDVGGFFGVVRFAPTFSDPDEVYQFPLNYQDEDSSTFQLIFNNPLIGAYYGTQGYRVNEVDAWGALSTPFGTFNCIRVITNVVQYDTINFGGTSTGINTHTREYKWLTNGMEIPALAINGPVVGGVFIPTTVEYRDSSRNVPKQFSPIALFRADSTLTGINFPLTINNLSFSLFSANYRWDIQPNTFNYANGTSATTDSVVVNFQDTGFYSVQLIARNSQGSDTLLINDYIYVDNRPVGIRELSSKLENNIQLFPNPVKKGQSISLFGLDDFELQQIDVLDLKGSLVQTTPISQAQPNSTVSAPNRSGIYFIRLQTSKGLVFKKVIVK